MKDFFIIIKRNFSSPIVIAILILALTLLALGEARDAWFISFVIIVNTLIAIIQEVRARNALRKLELMNAPRANRILDNGKIKVIPISEIVIGDKLKLNHGDEVPADGVLIESNGLEVDESILTGESASIDKNLDSKVYAASAVVAGNAILKVTAINEKTRVGKMTKTLKAYNPLLTPIQKNISRAITFLTYGAVFLAVLIFVVYFLSGRDAISIFKAITTAAVTVVPEGLLLGSSLLLAYGSLKLAKLKVLPQKLSAIEAMGLLDILCVDKTGTLTSDKITYESYQIFNSSDVDFEKAVGIIAASTDNGSSTNNAIMSGFKLSKRYKIIQTLPFSSERKMSGAKFDLSGKTYSVLMGAPEILANYAEINQEQTDYIKTLASQGKRVIMVVKLNDARLSLKDIKPNSALSLGIIILSNELRRGVKKTVSYLQERGVGIRVISGDNPDTVKYVARAAGISNYDKVITGSELKKLSDDQWDQAVIKNTIFARVLPEQKERLILSFKSLGFFTGMVGDGVNDALALKKSDLSVAMYSGSSAARRIADVVLLNDSFNSLPIGMKIGNRIMQAIEIIATLFFHKIIFGVVLLIATLAMGMVYPFLPRHITFMNIFLVTMPTIMWTIFMPIPVRRISPRNFWHDTLKAVLPIAILSGISVAITYAVLHTIHPIDITGVMTTTVIVATAFGIYLVFLIPIMFDIKNTRKARLARLLYVIATVLVVIPSFRFSFIRDFFDFSMPASNGALLLFVWLIFVTVLQWQIARLTGQRIRNRKN